MARAAVKTKYHKDQFKSGSGLMWTRDNVYFGFNGKEVTSSKAWQENGHIFPNIAKSKSVVRYQASAATANGAPRMCHRGRDLQTQREA